MRRFLSLIMVISISLSLCACGKGKNKDVKAAESAIADIGTVSADSGDKIKNAEKLYNVLSDSEKAQVENRAELVEARSAYDEILEDNKKQVLGENSKSIYENLNKAADICKKYMDSIYDAWHYGIYDAKDQLEWSDKVQLFLQFMSFEVSYIEEEDLVAAWTSRNSDKDISSAKFYDMNFDYCILMVAWVLEDKGIYTELNNCLDEAQKSLQEMAEQYGDSDNYIKLKEYYVKVKAYADFFKSPTGSFSELAATMTGYEKDIDNAKADAELLNI